LELNSPDVAGLDAFLPELIGLGTNCRVAPIDGLTALKQWVMPVAWGAIIDIVA
jgi:hypothetical protein